MNCPLCGTGNAYQGLLKISCVNSYCANYDAQAPAPVSFTTPGIPALTNPIGLNRTGIYRIQVQYNLARDILSCVPTKAIVAGGAPRDWDHGKEASDIDVFIYHDDPWVCKLDIENFFIAAFGSPIRFSRKKGANGSSSANVFKELMDVFEGTIGQETIQLIFVNSRWDGLLEEFVRETFDFGINKIYMKKYGAIFTFGDYISDKQNQTLTINLKDQVKWNRYSTLPERSNHILSKFPNHKIVLV